MTMQGIIKLEVMYSLLLQWYTYDSAHWYRTHIVTSSVKQQKSTIMVSLSRRVIFGTEALSETSGLVNRTRLG